MKLLGSPLTTRCRRAPNTMKLGFPHSCAHSVCKFNTRLPGTCLMAQRGSTPTLTANNQDGLQLGREQQSDGRVLHTTFTAGLRGRWIPSTAATQHLYYQFSPTVPTPCPSPSARCSTTQLSAPHSCVALVKHKSARHMHCCMQLGSTPQVQQRHRLYRRRFCQSALVLTNQRWATVFWSCVALQQSGNAQIVLTGMCL